MYDAKKLQLQDIQSKLLSIDDVKLRSDLEDFLSGYTTRAVEIPAGTYIYRARCLTSSFSKDKNINIRELHMPPATHTTRQRLNLANQPVFYCNSYWEPLFYEVRVAPETKLIISSWRLKTNALVLVIGYAKNSLASLGSTRQQPEWGRAAGFAKDMNDPNADIDFLGEILTQPVHEEDTSHYRITSILGSILLGKVEGRDNVLAGLLYPTVSMNGNGDNLAFAPWFANSHLDFAGAQEHLVLSRDGMLIENKCIDRLASLSPSGDINWRGIGGLELSEAGETYTAVATPGRAPDGFYMRLQDNQLGHWEFRRSDGSIFDRLA